ncbi:MAG: hypothetical protein H7X97_04545 [Opitutaceae bacterium]|nr:hypothetical protein [Verrucomicrobiales bacterium]
MMAHRFIIIACLVAAPLLAQIEVTAPAASQLVFPGTDRAIQVQLRNTGDKDIETPLGLKVSQASSSTAMPMGPVRPWKRMTIKAGQTVLDEFKTDLPSVRAATRFIVQCVDDGNLVLGRVDVFVYPTDLLTELIHVAGSNGLALFDPNDRMAPVLKRLEIPFAEWTFEPDHRESSAALLILGPFSEEHPLTEKMKQAIDALVRSGRRLVCLHQAADEIFPLSGVVTIRDSERGRLVNGPPALIADLDQSPTAQLALIRLVKLALPTHRLALAATKP